MGQQTTNLFYLNKNSPQGFKTDRRGKEGGGEPLLVCCYFWARLENLFLMPSGLDRRGTGAGREAASGCVWSVGVWQSEIIMSTYII